MNQATAIIVSRFRLSETSLVIRWCSLEEGLFKTVAKGALRGKSPFAGRLDLFVTCELAYTSSLHSDLHTLREVRLVEPRLGLRATYSRILAASYFCELVDLVAERETPLMEIGDLVRMALDHLTTHDPSEKLVLRFETRLCELLGLGAAQADAAQTLQEAFHRRLPSQRENLLRQLWGARP